MDLEQALVELGLGEDQTLTAEAARRAYMRQVRNHPPERDPEGFQRVRQAYELVQRLASRNIAVPRFNPPNIILQSHPNPSPDPDPDPSPSPNPTPDPEPDHTEAESDHTESESDLDPPLDNAPPNPTETLLWREYEIAITSSQPSAVAAALLTLFAHATPLTRMPPPQLAFRTVLELFEAGRREAARQLLSAFESYAARMEGLHLNGQAAAQWQLSRELAALSKVVKKRLTSALAAAIASNNIAAAWDELALERDRQGGYQLYNTMKQLAPSLHAAMPIGGAGGNPRGKSNAKWYGSGGAFGLLFVIFRLLAAMSMPSKYEDSPAPSPWHGAYADPPPLLPNSAAPTPSASAPTLEASALSGAAVMAVSELSSKVEKQYLAGQCDDVRQTWPKFAWEIRNHAPDAAVLKVYEFQRTRAITTCPDLATELPENP